MYSAEGSGAPCSGYECGAGDDIALIILITHDPTFLIKHVSPR